MEGVEMAYPDYKRRGGHTVVVGRNVERSDETISDRVLEGGSLRGWWVM